MRGLNAPPRRMLAPAALTWPAISSSTSRSRWRTARRSSPVCRRRPCTLPTSTTVSVLLKFPAGELERLEDRQHLLDAGDRLKRLGLQLLSSPMTPMMVRCSPR